ncbi:cytochrome P450 71B10-like, partial [Cucurbita pepo subsp. pepo]
MAFGKNFRGGELDNHNFHHVVRRAIVSLGYFSATDYFPRVGWIVDWLTGVHGRLEKSFFELDAFFQHVIDGRINFQATSQQEDNIIDVLLKSEKDGLQLSRDCIKALTMNIFLGGVDTGAGVIVWAMAELIRNPR